jgi:hypothetical protein
VPQCVEDGRLQCAVALSRSKAYVPAAGAAAFVLNGEVRQVLSSNPLRSFTAPRPRGPGGRVAELSGSRAFGSFQGNTLLCGETVRGDLHLILRQRCRTLRFADGCNSVVKGRLLSQQ